MKRTVEISSRVGHHLDLADLKLGARRVAIFRLFAAEVIRDDRRRQTLVGDQAVLDCVTEVDEFPIHCHFAGNQQEGILAKLEVLRVVWILEWAGARWNEARQISSGQEYI